MAKTNSFGSALGDANVFVDGAGGLANATGAFADMEESERAGRTFLPIKDNQKLDADLRMRLLANKEGSSVGSRHDDLRLREKLLLRGGLKPAWRKESLERRLRGPLVAKHGPRQPGILGNLGDGGGGSIPGSSPMPDLIVPQKKSLRPTSPTYESAFRRHVVNRPVSPGVQRGRSSLGLSPSNSFNKVKRTPSPNLTDVPSELMRRKAEKARKARLYLLQQAGPNSFVIAGGLLENKFKVVVGPQTCSCGKGANACVHVLFVMLRVFQLDETDGIVWSRQLRNYEVESLFNNFHMRRTQRIRSSLPQKQDDAGGCSTGREAALSNAAPSVGNAEQQQQQQQQHSLPKLRQEEETTCPICLLDMKGSELLVLCEACHNTLHQRCMAVWFRLCGRQGDLLSCPLCRAKWKHLDADSLKAVSAAEEDEDYPNPPIAASAHESNIPAASHGTATGAGHPPDIVATLPRADPMPEESRSLAAPWITVFGEELVSCIFSRNWVTRETALRHLSQQTVRMLTSHPVSAATAGQSAEGGGGGNAEAVLESCCQILAMTCADPVYKVYVAALRALRTLLLYTSCGNGTRLQVLLRPVLHSILLKCADGNRRTSQLSLSTLSEFCKGQTGELAVGTEAPSTEGHEGLGGLPFVLDCTIKDFDIATTQWQWLLGRLAAVEKLMEEFPAEFTLAEDSTGARTSIVSLETTVLSLIRFSLKAMKLSHTRILRTAKKVFLVASRIALSSFPGALQKICDALNLVDLGMQSRLEKRLHEVAQRVACPDLSSSIEPRFAQRSQFGRQSSSSAPQSRVPSPNPSYDEDYVEPTSAAATAKRPHTVAPNARRSKTVFGCLYQAVAFPESSKSKSSLGSGAEVVRGQGSASSGLACGKAYNDNNKDGERPVAKFCNVTPHKRSDSYAYAVQSDGFVTMVQAFHRVHAPLAEWFEAVSQGCESTAKDSEGQAIASSNLAGPQRQTPCSVTKTCEQTERSLDSASTAAYLQLSHDSGIGVCSSTSAVDEGTARGVRLQDGEGLCRDKMPTPLSAAGAHDVVESASSSLESAAATAFKTAAASAALGCSSRGEGASSGSGDEQKTSDSSALLTEDLSELAAALPSDNSVSFKSEVAVFSPLRRTPDNLDAGNECHCKDEVELEEAIALARAMDVSMRQDDLPRVPGLCNRYEEETITIHVQGDVVDSAAGAARVAVEYLESVHWKRGPMLGTGAFSTCYQARDVRTGTIMAVKQISFCRNSMVEQDKICEAVREEIQMMARLNHPNIVRILGATQTGCHFNMFVEWMPGGSVAHLLEVYGALSEPVTASYVQQVLMGLAYLHDNHVLHRDLKGANLLVDSTGKHLRIGDFGACARLATQTTGAGEFRGQLLGTIAFMAPEVLRGEHYGRACDVWGVGCVMIEMATTRPPWSASAISNHLKLMFTIASTTLPPPIPENLSPAVKDLMLRCLEANPAYRPSAKELLQHPLFTRYTYRR